MNNNIYISAITALLYFTFKFFESRFIKKKQPQLKVLFRDALIVGISCVLADFVFGQFSSLAIEGVKTPNVFTNEPDF